MPIRREVILNGEVYHFHGSISSILGWGFIQVGHSCIVTPEQYIFTRIYFSPLIIKNLTYPILNMSSCVVQIKVSRIGSI